MKSSQKNKIKNHLKFYGKITPLEALDNFGCMRLSERIRELKMEGMDIVTKINTGKKKFAIYKLQQTRLF